MSHVTHRTLHSLGIVQCSMGHQHAAVKTGTGDVWVWGSCARGQLGLGTLTALGTSLPSKMPLPFPPGSVVKVSTNISFLTLHHQPSVIPFTTSHPIFMCFVVPCTLLFSPPSAKCLFAEPLIAVNSASALCITMSPHSHLFLFCLPLPTMWGSGGSAQLRLHTHARGQKITFPTASAVAVVFLTFLTAV